MTGSCEWPHELQSVYECIRKILPRKKSQNVQSCNFVLRWNFSFGFFLNKFYSVWKPRIWRLLCVFIADKKHRVMPKIQILKKNQNLRFDENREKSNLKKGAQLYQHCWKHSEMKFLDHVDDGKQSCDPKINVFAEK